MNPSFTITGDRPRDIWVRDDELETSRAVLEGKYSLLDHPRVDSLTAWARDRLEANQRPLIIDANPGSGASTVYFSLAYPYANILALEPDPRNKSRLERNIEGLEYVSWLPYALSDGRDFLELDGEELVPARKGPLIRAVTVGDFAHCQAGVPFIVCLGHDQARALRAWGSWVDSIPVVFTPEGVRVNV